MIEQKRSLVQSEQGAPGVDQAGGAGEQPLDCLNAPATTAAAILVGRRQPENGAPAFEGGTAAIRCRCRGIAWTASGAGLSREPSSFRRASPSKAAREPAAGQGVSQSGSRDADPDAVERPGVAQ